MKFKITKFIKINIKILMNNSDSEEDQDFNQLLQPVDPKKRLTKRKLKEEEK
jgi:hypothetical protein